MPEIWTNRINDSRILKFSALTMITTATPCTTNAVATITFITTYASVTAATIIGTDTTYTTIIATIPLILPLLLL